MKLEIKINIWFRGEIEKKNQFNKRPKISKELGPNSKNNMINWDGRMKLKTNRISTKEPRNKTRNQKNKDWSWNINNKKG